MYPKESDELISIMLETAREDGSIYAIVNAIEQYDMRHGLEHDVIRTIKLFRAAFQLTIVQAKNLGRWQHFVDSGGISNREIDDILMPLIRNNLGIS